MTGETAERAAMLALRDILEDVTDVMNGADFPSELSGQAADFAEQIDLALEGELSLGALRADAIVLLEEWLKRGDIEDGYEELVGVERVLRALPRHITPAPSQRPVVPSLGTTP